MTHKQLFVHDLKRWLMPALGDGARATSVDEIRADTLNALRSVLIEIEEASVFTAITASISGALAEDRANTLTPQHLMSYLPPDPEVYQRSIETILAAALAPSVILPVQGYHARLSYALRLTRAIADAGPAPTPGVRASEYAKLDEAWRHVCGTALAAISVLREVLASVRYSRPPANNEHAEALLRSAKAGGRPCVTNDGSVRMPRWAESRVHARHVTKQSARILVHNTARDVLIENVSRTGLGISGLTGEWPVGARVAVELAHGERIMGKVMWVRGPRAGLHLEAMLDPDHPLLATAGEDLPRH